MDKNNVQEGIEGKQDTQRAENKYYNIKLKATEEVDASHIPDLYKLREQARFRPDQGTTGIYKKTVDY